MYAALPEIYNKAIKYMKSSHNMAELKSIDDLNAGNENENSMMDIKLANEVEKYNQMKLKKQVCYNDI